MTSSSGRRASSAAGSSSKSSTPAPSSTSRRPAAPPMAEPLMVPLVLEWVTNSPTRCVARAQSVTADWGVSPGGRGSARAAARPAAYGGLIGAAQGPVDDLDPLPSGSIEWSTSVGLTVPNPGPPSRTADGPKAALPMTSATCVWRGRCCWCADALAHAPRHGTHGDTFRGARGCARILPWVNAHPRRALGRDDA